MDRKAHQVLVIDDSPVDRLLLSSVLQKEGYRCISAANGPEGRRQARECHPDIILLDVLLPGETGFQTCAQLKMDPVTSSIPVLFLSSENDKQSRVAGLTGGGVDYITKPFETEEVLARLRIHLRIRHAFEALIEQQKEQLSRLKIAQQAILVQPDELPDAKFAVHYRPLYTAGGDFYDVIPLGEDIYGYFSADISGHDLGAAFITSALKVLLQQNFNSLYTPFEIMMLLNGVLYPILDDGVFLSACFARLNRRSGRFSVVTAAHPPILHLDSRGGMNSISAEGDLLGAFEAPYFESKEIKVEKGDRLFLFSDGLIENYRGEKISRTDGMHKLEGSLVNKRGLSLSKLVDAVAYSICGAHENPGDDLMLLGIEASMNSTPMKSWIISARLSNVDLVCREISTWLTEQDLYAHLFPLELLAREALNNAILHGCRLDPALHVCCELQCTETALQLKIKDDGNGFEWQSYLQGDIVDGHDEDGRGLQLYRLYADSIEFNPCGNQVVLTRLLKI